MASDKTATPEQIAEITRLGTRRGFTLAADGSGLIGRKGRKLIPFSQHTPDSAAGVIDALWEIAEQ